MMTLSEKRQPKSKRFGLGFSVRTLLVFITLVAIALAIYEPLTLPFKAVHFFNLKNSVRATHPNPKTGSGKGTRLNLNLIPMTLYLFPYIYLISIPAKIEVKVKLAS